MPAATWRFVMDIRRITADRAIFSNFVGCKPISPIVPGARILKKCVRAAGTARKQVSHTGSASLTIQTIPHRLYSFFKQPKLLTIQVFPTQAIQFFKQPKLLTTQVSHTVTRKNKRPNRGQRKSYEKP